jgi:hypothetical protein
LAAIDRVGIGVVLLEVKICVDFAGDTVDRMDTEADCSGVVGRLLFGDRPFED